MRDRDVMGNLGLMGLGDPPSSSGESMSYSNESPPTIPYQTTQATPRGGSTTYVQQSSKATQDLARARSVLAAQAEANRLKQQADQAYAKKQAEQKRIAQVQAIVAANLQAKMILEAAQAKAAQTAPVAASAGMMQPAQPAQDSTQPTPVSTGWLWSLSSKIPSFQLPKAVVVDVPALPDSQADVIRRQIEAQSAASRSANYNQAYQVEFEAEKIRKEIEAESASRRQRSYDVAYAASTGSTQYERKLNEVQASFGDRIPQGWRERTIAGDWERAFGVPSRPMFDPFGLAESSIQKWKSNYESIYGPVPTTAQGMLDALNNKPVLDALARDEELKRNEASLSDRQSQAIQAQAEKEREQALAREQSLADAKGRALEASMKRAWAESSGRAVEAARLSKDEAAKESVRQALEEIKWKADRAKAEDELLRQANLRKSEAEYEAKARASEALAKEASKTPEILVRVQQMTPDQREEYLSESMRDINKRNFINENIHQIEYSLRAQADERYSNPYKQQEYFEKLRSEKIEELSDKFDKKNPLTYVASTDLNELIATRTLGKLSPAFVTDISQFKKRWGDGSEEYTADSADKMLVSWVKAMFASASENPSDLESYVKAFVGRSIKFDDVMSLKRAYSLAADSSISSSEREKRMVELARTMNAFSGQVTQASVGGVKTAGAKRIASQIVQLLEKVEAARGSAYAGGTESGLRGYTWVF